MDRSGILAVLQQAFVEIAPDVELASLDPDAELQVESDIDSMDFLNLVAAVDRELGVEIPERDYPRIRTLRSLVDYLLARQVEVR
jgi:acyl carrier protein